MIQLKRTNSEDKNFQLLVRELDKELKIRDGDEHVFYSLYNKIDEIRHVVVAYYQEIPVGCGAIKEYSPEVMEVKRMFVPAKRRSQGIASLIMKRTREMD
ncbi:MAG: GNAT family N-acetyltransferase [Flavobacteriaceae bacterium]|nr:GNAT family N-acetyltransferase [Flavobacteriaceae bacterium]